MKLKRTLFRSAVKWFIQSPTIPFLMNWPLPCLLHSSRTRYFVKSCIFPTYVMFFLNLSPIWSLYVQWTGLLVVVKLHVLVQSLKNVIVKKFNRPVVLWCELLPGSLPRSRQSLWSRRSSSTCPLDPALAPHTFKVKHCSSDLCKTFLTNRTSCFGDFFASIQTPASQKTHRASTSLVDKSPW